jgi:hypothetical protein
VKKQESSQNINAIIKTGALEKHNPSPREKHKINVKAEITKEISTNPTHQLAATVVVSTPMPEIVQQKEKNVS